MTSKKTALITGATSGIGTVVAEHLAKVGFNIVVFGRTPGKVDALIRSLTQINPEIVITGILCDLSSLESTKNACDEVNKNHSVINLMILNAGLWNVERRQTTDAIEETLHVNLLSQIQVADELIALLPKDGNSKIIITASSLHHGKINFNDLEFKTKFSGIKAYRQSKLCVILMTRWLAKQHNSKGISFYSVHPGGVRTNIARSAGWYAKLFFSLFGKSPEKGAQTHIHLIDTNNASLSNGNYYANKKVTKTTTYSYDMEVAERLSHEIAGYFK
jgi:NAD(P)-dependent dehydrogenase (short-subunit alcohol dehydrogenase family)